VELMKTFVTGEVKLTERQVQNALYIHCAIKNHELIVPNSCLFAWESDVVSVLKSGFICEFEIKISRADFKADTKKRRTEILVNPHRQRDLWGGGVEVLAPHSRPNYFYYAVPAGLIAAEEVPAYAGLLYVHRMPDSAELVSTMREIKPAQRIHNDKMNDWQRHQLMRAVNVRYWRQRLAIGVNENVAL
jgi:hypothetical protein